MSIIQKQKEFYTNREQSYAVIITNSQYDGENGTYANLSQADQDKNLVIQHLTQYGMVIHEDFILTNKEQQDYQDMFTKLRALVKSQMSKDQVTVFIYYSGHGIQIKSDVHAVLKDKTYFNLDQNAHTISTLPNTCVFTLFDCCRQTSKNQSELNMNQNQSNKPGINGALHQIYSTTGNNVTNVNLNEKYSKMTQSFFELCNKFLVEEKQGPCSIQEMVQQWSLNGKYPLTSLGNGILFFEISNTAWNKSQTCEEDHPLQLISYYEQLNCFLTAVCEVCDFEITENEQSSYHCKSCQYYKCMQCFCDDDNDNDEQEEDY